MYTVLFMILHLLYNTHTHTFAHLAIVYSPGNRPKHYRFSPPFRVGMHIRFFFCIRVKSLLLVATVAVVILLVGSQKREISNRFATFGDPCRRVAVAVPLLLDVVDARCRSGAPGVSSESSPCIRA